MIEYTTLDGRGIKAVTPITHELIEREMAQYGHVDVRFVSSVPYERGGRDYTVLMREIRDDINAVVKGCAVALKEDSVEILMVTGIMGRMESVGFNSRWYPCDFHHKI